MKATLHRCVVVLLVVLVAAVVKVSPARFVHGREADRLCEAYKKVCPRGKVCAIQVVDLSSMTMKFPVCVHLFQVKVRSPVCKQAPSPGRCNAVFRRWYFNVHVAACSWFTYSGCGGNDNNFRSREECERMCVVGEQADRDMASDVIAPGRAEPRRHSDPRHHHNRHHSNQKSAYRYSPEGEGAYPAGSQPFLPANITSGSDKRVDGRNNGNDGYRSDKSRYDLGNVRNSSPDRASRTGPLPILAINTKQSMANKKDPSSFDVYGTPYIHTSTIPTLLDRKKPGTFAPPPDRRRRPEQRRPIRRRPRPSYEQRSLPDDTPAALELQPPNDHGSVAIRASENNRRVTIYPDRRFANFSNKTRRLTDNQNLGNPPRPPSVSVTRRMQPIRTPSRVISLMSRPPGPLNTTPGQTYVRAGRNSSRRASYAPEANETIRKFPSRRQMRKRHRGSKRRHRRRRRRRGGRGRGRGRRRGRKNRTRKGWKKNFSRWPYVHNRNRAGGGSPGSNSTFLNASSSSPSVDLKNKTYLGLVAELRTKNYSRMDSSRTTQSDEAMDRGAANVANMEKARKRRRRNRRRKGRTQRGKTGRMGGGTEAASGRASVSSLPAEDRYYEKIHLFGLMDKPRQNETRGGA